MISKIVIAGIIVGVFFAGVGISYAIFASTYDPNTMKFQNQEMFDQMMSQNPKMTQRWMDTGMMENSPIMQSLMNTMMNDPEVGQEIMKQMMQNPEMMSGMMGSGMMDSELSGSMMSGMSFNVDAPMTMPMIDGYYNGEKIYFVHTEVSDKDMADMMSRMINFPTLHVSDLMNISPDEMSKVYVFTNGISGSGPYGGGPFMYQIDVFDSIPGQMGHSQFRVPHLVTWNENSTPRIMTSVDEILEAEANGELTIQKTSNVVNAPMIVWKSDGMEQRASMIQRMFESMPGVDGEITNVDVDNYIVMLKMHSGMGKGMMDMMN
jgi:hypothetical protein